ncbi:hypothetical protein PAMP_002345 [Pampus punctatissimus]
MSADVPSNPAVGLLWISSRLQGMGIPFPFTAFPGRKKGKDAFSLLSSHRLKPEAHSLCLLLLKPTPIPPKFPTFHPPPE